MAGFFYAMVPDIDGRQRLHVEWPKTTGKTKSIPSDAIAARWDRMRQEFVDFYRPACATDAAATNS